MRNRRLVGLLDLAHKTENVRGKIASYLNHLISLGVVGFRVDACKHMWPGDLENIYGRLNVIKSDGMPPFMYNEVNFVYLCIFI